MHLDLETDDVEAEVQRIETLGATRWDHQQERGHDFWVLRDPWANEFCVLQINFPELLAQRRTWADPMEPDRAILTRPHPRGCARGKPQAPRPGTGHQRRRPDTTADGCAVQNLHT